MTSELRPHERVITLDCFGMRDRSWGPRYDDATAHASGVSGTCEGGSFLVVTQQGNDGDLSMGYCELEGTRSRLKSVALEFARDEVSRVAAVTIRG